MPTRRPLRKLIRLTLRGEWYPDGGRMLRDGVGIQIEASRVVQDDWHRRQRVSTLRGTLGAEKIT